MKNKIVFGSALLLLLMFTCSCAHRDCQGHKKTTKTEMGGWL